MIGYKEQLINIFGMVWITMLTLRLADLGSVGIIRALSEICTLWVLLFYSPLRCTRLATVSNAVNLFFFFSSAYTLLLAFSLLWTSRLQFGALYSYRDDCIDSLKRLAYMSTLGIKLDYRSHKYFSLKNSKVSVDFSYGSFRSNFP